MEHIYVIQPEQDDHEYSFWALNNAPYLYSICIDISYMAVVAYIQLKDFFILIDTPDSNEYYVNNETCITSGWYKKL